MDMCQYMEHLLPVLVGKTLEVYATIGLCFTFIRAVGDYYFSLFGDEGVP